MKCNIKNRTIFNKDNIEILKGINSNCIDLIYIDPPFNKKKVFTAPIGSSAEGASFKDWFRKEDVKDEWLLTIKEDNEKLYAFLESVKTIEGKTSYNYCYLSYIAIRLIELHRILKDTGSIYLHCDPTMSHYLKILMDIIFSEDNFRNELVWSYQRWTNSLKGYTRTHDILFFYSKSQNVNWYKPTECFSQKSQHKGQRLSKTNIGKVISQTYINEKREKAMRDVWEISILNSQAKERTGYPTQKPLALLERIITASSKEGDIIMDAFCGCATTCVASEKLNRQWIGIDVSVKAYDLVKERLNKEVKEGESALFNWNENIIFKTDVPIRTDDNREDKREKKYIYVISNSSYPNEYKVGIASNYKSRLNSYQTSDPNRNYQLEYKIITHLFRETEKHIHDTFENRHEWVRANKDDIIKEIKKYINDN